MSRKSVKVFGNCGEGARVGVMRGIDKTEALLLWVGRDTDSPDDERVAILSEKKARALVASIQSRLKRKAKP